MASHHCICIYAEGFPQRLLTGAEVNAIHHRVGKVMDRAMKKLVENGHVLRFQGF